MPTDSKKRHRGYYARTLSVLAFWLLIVVSAQAQISRTSEQTALDGLLAITEAQTRFAARNGRYADSISELGFQASVMSAGQLTMKSAYDANFDNPKRISAEGYFFRILPVRGQSGNESNSFWATAIPDGSRSDLPVFFTVAYHVKTITYPLVNWWALRLHDENRLMIAKTLGAEAAVTVQDIGLNPDNPESFPNARVVRRFLLDPKDNYPPTVQSQAPVPHSWTLSLIGAVAVGLIVLLFIRKSKKADALSRKNTKTDSQE